MANISRGQAEEMLKEKTAECDSLREDLAIQVEYGAELKRGILGYKEQKKMFQEKISYLTRQLHGDAVDEGFELRKVVPIVEAGVQCEAGALTVHDALFGDKEGVEESPTLARTASPLSPRNAADAPPTSPTRAGAEAPLPAVGGAAPSSPHDITAQCNQQ